MRCQGYTGVHALDGIGVSALQKGSLEPLPQCCRDCRIPNIATSYPLPQMYQVSLLMIWHSLRLLSIYIYTFMYMYTHIHMHIYIHVNIHIHIHIYVYVYVCAYRYIHMYIHIWIHTHIYTYVDKFMYIHTHICVCMHIKTNK